MATITKDVLGWLQYGYDQKKDYFEKDRSRWIENAKMYWGVDYGQWPMQVVQQLLEEGRQAPTFNIMSYKMDGLRGSLLRNQFDMKYVPISGDSDDWALKMQQMWYSDKDNMNWDWSYDIFLRDFLIQYGAEWMYIDTSQSPFGNIAFRPDTPYNLFPDPGWKTPFHKDLRELDKIAFYSANELKRLYPNKASEIDDVYLRQKYATKYQNASVDYRFDAPEIGPAYQQLDKRWDSKQLIIERHEIIEEVKDWEYNIRDGEWFPDGGHKQGSMEDIAFKKQYMEQRSLAPDDIHFIPKNVKRYHITSGCPTLDIVLENKDSIIQIGSIPCFMTGPAKMGTQYRGLGDMVKDIQTNTNKYMMMMSEILNKAARGGMFVNEDIVGGDRARMSEVEMQWNNPAARIWVKPVDAGMIDKYVKEIPSAHIPNDLMVFHGLMSEYADKLSMQPPAAEGRTESSREPAKLYQSKFEAHMISRGAIDTMLAVHEHSKAEAYILQSQNTYSGIPREFSTLDGKSKFEINASGPYGMEWDISKAGRMKVIIEPSQKGVDVRINQRGVYMELKMGTRDPLMAAIYDKRIVNTIEMPEEEKEEAKAALEMITKEAAMAKMLNMKQMEMQLGQMMAPPEAQAGMEAEAAGAEGALPPEGGQIPVSPGKRPTMKEGVKGTPLEGNRQMAKIAQNVQQPSAPNMEQGVSNQ